MKRDCLSLERPRETKARSRRNGFDLDVFPSRRRKREDEGEEEPAAVWLRPRISHRAEAPRRRSWRGTDALPTALSVFACRGIAPLSPFLATTRIPRRNPRRRYLISENSMRRHNYGVTRCTRCNSDES